MSEITSLVLSLLFLAGAHAAELDGEACLDCHADPELVREGDYRAGASVWVDTELLATSVHEGLKCIDCHADASDDHEERLAAAACASCHADVEKVYAGSLHGMALARGEMDAPVCGDCHGGHDIRPVEAAESRVSRQRLAFTCAACHGDPDFIERRRVTLASPLFRYEQSVHFAALEKDGGGATCTDCHGVHDLRQRGDPASTIHRDNISRTCGQCHGEIRDEYEQTVHGRAVRFGATAAPTCIDCHGEHEIRSPDDPLSSVYPTAIVNRTCVQCHGNERITSRYGLEVGRFSSYRDTYHGLAIEDGSVSTANCTSCHGVHNILPSTDPASTIHPDHLQQTCGTCHPSAGERFAAIPVHPGAGPPGAGSRLSGYVRDFYLLLILVTVLGMVLHNGALFVHALREKYRRTRSGSTWRRFTPFQVTQHTVLVLSFATLAVTGFALKFPGVWWVNFLAHLGMQESLRRVVHRTAGVVMLVQSFTYAVYLLATGQGRRELAALLPRRQDLRDLLLNLRYHLGRAHSKPAFGRYSYIEKVEFWALVWGITVMGLTGVTMWIPELAMRLLPAWGFTVSELIHYYEAWLAILAILAWHVFFVILHPSAYPLNMTCLDGRISQDELIAHHPLERGDSTLEPPSGD